MKAFRSTRLFLLALLLCVVPASSYAGVFISVGFAPPPLVVYEQPPCPEDGYLWTPGYWAYGDDGYYWVPGAWVPAPQPGYLWTPPYWGFEGGHYRFFEGYWGPHVGYYGGVNYGFGYMGMGFAGGEWRGGRFAYNTAVVRVNTTVIHNTYVNTTIVHNTTIINNNHVAYAGGPGGIRHEPTQDERRFSSEKHEAPTAVQTRHIESAAKDPQQHFNTNHGRPATTTAMRPMTNPVHTQANATGRVDNHPTTGRPEPTARPATPTNRPETSARPTNRPETTPRPATPESRPTPQSRPESRPATQQPRPESRPVPQSRPETRPAPAPRPESRPAPQPHSAPAPHPSNEKPEHPHGRGR